MDIENIFAPSEEMDFAPEFNIESGFFNGGFDIPEERFEKKTEQKIQPVTNWKFVINRAFMRGLTIIDIMNSICEKINSLENSQEILDYMEKYEGLMGTVFLDISVLDNGFPINSIPKKFRPFHRFAVNCRNHQKVVSRAVQGGVGGTLNNVLNTSEKLRESSSEVCYRTGLPVLKKGMFDKKIIKELLDYIGVQGETMKDLQNALREKILGLVITQKTDVTENADLDYGLKSELEITPIPEASKDNKGNNDIILGYRASGEDDIKFNDVQKSLEGVKLDDNLRF